MSITEATVSCYSTGVLFDEDFFLMTGDEWDNLYRDLTNYAFNMSKYKEGWIINKILYFLATVSDPPKSTIPTTSPIMGLTITLADDYFYILVDFFYNVNGTINHRLTKLFITDLIIESYLNRSGISNDNINIKDIIRNFKSTRTSRLSFTYAQWLEILEFSYSYWILSSGYRVKIEQETLNDSVSLKSTIDNTNTMVIIILVLIILIVIIMMLYKHRIVPEETK